jgi:toxin FitB
MSGFLLDTNCISEAVRVHPEARVLSWLGAVEEPLLHLSVLTLGEIRKGVAALTQGKRRTLLETWLAVELQARFAGRILPIDAGVADRWDVVAAAVKAKGQLFQPLMGYWRRRRVIIISRSFHATSEISRTRKFPCSIHGKGRPRAGGCNVIDFVAEAGGVEKLRRCRVT